MKNSIRVLLLASLLILSSRAVWAEDLSFVETEVIEQVLEKAQVEQSTKTLIRVGEGKVFEFETMPDREAMKQALGLNIPDKVKEKIIARGGVIEDVNPMEAYESLSADRQAKFQEARLTFLTSAARILSKTKFVFGAGSLVGDGLSFVKIKTKQAFGKEVEQTDRVRRTFNTRSHDAVQAVLRGIDYKLWSQAPLVIDSNEYGISVSAGILGETGVLRKGMGGAEEVGLSMGFNKTKKAFVFEIFHNSEKFDNTKAAISVLGVVGKAGLTLSRRDGVQNQKGSSFYPPAVPGYSSSSPNYFAAGFSSSLGFPPPPFADLMTFTNEFERHTLIRITVSPVVKGFVRIQIGDARGSVRLVAMRFVDVFRAINDKVFRAGGRSCGPVFN